jgi:hypothetical protein
MDSSIIYPLLFAGVLAGVVNFFVNDVNLPFGKSANLEALEPTALKDIWWVALIGYIVVGWAGSFLTPLLNALVNPLKGMDWTLPATKRVPTFNDYLVFLGYGVVFGYSTTRLLVSILDAINKKVNALDARMTAFKPIRPNLSFARIMDSNSTDIIDECESQFEKYKSDCSGFAKAVAAAFGIKLTGLADEIVNEIQQNDWVKLGKDGAAAKAKADAGWFVVGGLLSSDNVPPQKHGHVVVVVSGPLAQNKYPTAYWGRLDGVGEKNKTINWAWNSESRDKVIYAARQIAN